MATNNSKATDFLETVVNAQKNFVNQVVETTKKITKDNPLVNDAIDKGQKMYNEATDTQTKFAKEATDKINNTFETAQQKTEQSKNHFQEWFDNQTNWSKNMFNQNTNQANPFANMFGTNSNDWMNSWKNFTNPMQNWNGMQNPLFANMFSQNPFGFNMNANPMQDGMNQWNQYYKQYMDMTNNMYGADWHKNFENMTSADSFGGMKNMSESLTKFYELWTPLFQKMQEGKFNMEDFNSIVNPTIYKEFMDKFFSFMPDDSKKVYEQMSHNFVSAMKQMSEGSMNGFNSFKTNMQQAPWMQANPNANIWEMYTNWKNMMQEAVSPLTKLMGDNDTINQAKVWSDIYDRMLEFNIKNNELQMMMYQHGNKVMEQLAKDVYEKVQNGEDFDSIIKIYQQWMMKGDEVFTALFETDEYSKLMTEVSSLQMNLKMDIEKQMEKLFFVNIPVATRSEMDEVYKSIYDLKKTFRNMEKIFNLEVEPVVKAEKTTKTATKKATVKVPVKKVAKKASPKTATKKAAKRK